jgi:iron donor protein CyaY
MELDEKTYDRLAAATLARIDQAFADVDPDRVEAVVSDGVVKLEFQGRRRPWVVSTQRAARQVWLAAEQHAWHFAHAGDDAQAERWVAHKTGEELFATLARLLREHERLELEF